MEIMCMLVMLRQLLMFLSVPTGVPVSVLALEQ